MTHTLIYPHTSAHNAAGHLEIGGCDVVDLAREFGTPLFIYDEQTLRDQCRAYHAAFGARTDLYEIVYASKAFSCRAMAELVAQEDLSLDVATGGELAAALAGGFPAGRIYFHGNNKSPAEIEAGLDAGIGHFVVDSFEEIERLEAAAAARGRSQDVLVRVTPGVRPNTHDFIQTGQQDSKFGFGLADGRAHEAVRRLKDARPPRARRRARAHRLADLRARLVPARGRGPLRRHRRLAPRLRLRLPHLQHRRRPRHPLHRGRPAQLHRRVRGDRRRRRARRARRSTACRCRGSSSSRGGASPARRP